MRRRKLVRDWSPLYAARDVVEHRGGIWWHAAPRPLRMHRCRPWTRAWLGAPTFHMIERCACGALRYGGGRWVRRNSR